jgi:type VI secretion system protein ImpI
VQVIEQAGAGGGAPPPSAAAPAPAWNDTGNPWGVSGEAPPPADRRDFMPPPDRGPRPPDFLDWAVSVETPSMPAPAPYAPAPYAPPPYAPPPQAAPPADWGAPSFADSEPQVPTPRRPAPAWEAPPAPAAAAPAPPAWEEPSPVAPEQPAWEAPPPPPAARTQPEPPEAPMLPPEPAPNAAVASDTLARIARAAGIPADVVASRRPDELADEIGTALRLTAHHLAQMLASRAETKSLVRSANRTMIQALDNNPLKFSPTPEDALKIMFGAPSRSYMRAVPAIEESFRDLKTHQVQTYSAMQGALEALYEDLSPTTIDKSVDQDKGIGAMLSSRKAKLWDVYTERWKAKTGRSDGRLVDAFMLLFAECYDRLKGKG